MRDSLGEGGQPRSNLGSPTGRGRRGPFLRRGLLYLGLPPALLVALALTYTRNAWVGAWVAVGLLMMLKDLRLLFILPIVAALFLVAAPPRLTDRLYSIFDM